MDELRVLATATNAVTVKEIPTTVTAIAKDNDAHAKAQRELFAAANTITTSPPIAANATAISHPTAANATAPITMMAELRELVAATQALAAANVTKIDAYAKANQGLFAANAMATTHPIAANAMATSHPIAANATAFSHPTVAVSKENNIPPSHGTCDGHDHATGGIVLAMNSPGLPGVASAAVLSLSACVMESSPSLTVTTSFPTLVTVGGIAPNDACPPPAYLYQVALLL